MSDFSAKFIKTGGEFLSPLSVIQQKADKIKALVFDWDGVFNNGEKDSNNSSSYSEGDSMGTNLLRFGYYLKNGRVPITAIFTGAINELSVRLTKREHFDYLIYRCLDKGRSFEEFLKNNELKAEEVAFCFDDVLDVPVAERCGLSFYINSPGRPLFEDYLKQKNIYDYKTGNTGGENAVREVCELILGAIGQYTSAIQNRLAFSDTYQNYLKQRNAIEPLIVEWQG